MEWKWVKNLLIILFLILDCFLVYQVYQRNTASVINPESVQALESILSAQNITYDLKFSEIETKKYMRKINISNEENIEEKFIPISSIEKQDVEYKGRNREIISLTSVIASFIRETKMIDAHIENIALGYYPEISQIDKNILFGEATPAWLIKLSNGQEYIYNAYRGDLIAQNEFAI